MLVRLLLLGLVMALGGCVGALPAAVATEPLWGPLVEAAVKGAVEAMQQEKK